MTGVLTCPKTNEPTHNDRFIATLNDHYPTWHEARAELNELPLTAEALKG